MKIRIDRDTCIGEGLCVSTCPGVFDLDEEEKCYVVDPNGGDEACIREAAEACPVQAIILEDEETGEQIYP
ncbi:MAG: ferredoxin [Armatimonadota bacterium]